MNNPELQPTDKKVSSPQVLKQKLFLKFLESTLSTNAKFRMDNMPLPIYPKFGMV